MSESSVKRTDGSIQLWPSSDRRESLPQSKVLRALETIFKNDCRTTHKEPERTLKQANRRLFMLPSVPVYGYLRIIK